MIPQIALTALALFMTTPPSLAAPASLACTATGTKLLSPPTPPTAACARMKAALEKAMVKKLADAAPATAALSLDLRFTRPGTASAYLVERRGGRVITHPPISVDVMDRALDLKIIDLLANAVAKHLEAR